MAGSWVGGGKGCQNKSTPDGQTCESASGYYTIIYVINIRINNIHVNIIVLLFISCCIQNMCKINILLFQRLPISLISNKSTVYIILCCFKPVVKLNLTLKCVR